MVNIFKNVPNILNDNNLLCLDVGGAGGVIDYFVPFLNFISIDLFEPDQNACLKVSKISHKNVNCYPIALGEYNEKVDFYVTNKPSKSSIYKPNTKYCSRYKSPVLTKIKRKIKLETITYSKFREFYKRPPANIVKLDTQGSELNILKSFSKEELKNVICIQSEVEFHELYKGQPLFKDLDNFLNKEGFKLFDLRTARTYLTKGENTNHYLKKLGYLGNHGSSNISAILFAGDTLYFREFKDNCPKDKNTFINLLLSYLIFCYFDHALELIELGLKFKIINLDDAKELEDFIIKICPKPKIHERKGIISGLLRKILRIVGFNGTYKTFWTKSNWPCQ